MNTQAVIVLSALTTAQIHRISLLPEKSHLTKFALARLWAW
jgi:hypothetical protein